MTDELDDAVEQAEQLADRLRDTQEYDGELEVTEDEIVMRVAEILGAVRRHNDTLAERGRGPQAE